MQLLLPLLIVGIAGQPATSAVPEGIEEIRSAIPGDAACAKPSADDARPYTLCLAEFQFDQAEAAMSRQWAVTLAHVRATKGERDARRLRKEPRKWVSVRDSECARLAAAYAAHQQGRNHMSCMAGLTENRTAFLEALAEAEL